MNDIDCSYDDLLCRSLSLFRQFRLYDDRIEEDNAFVFLREAEKVVSDTRNGVCVAKLGCVIECLAHRFYINDDTDVILEEVDAFLIKFWKGLKQPSPETFIASLWIGEYFLLRLKNPKSRLHGRSKKMVSKILSFMADMLRKPEKQKDTQDLYFPVDSCLRTSVYIFYMGIWRVEQNVLLLSDYIWLYFIWSLEFEG